MTKRVTNEIIEFVCLGSIKLTQAADTVFGLSRQADDAPVRL